MEDFKGIGIVSGIEFGKLIKILDKLVEEVKIDDPEGEVKLLEISLENLIKKNK